MVAWQVWMYKESGSDDSESSTTKHAGHWPSPHLCVAEEEAEEPVRSTDPSDMSKVKTDEDPGDNRAQPLYGS